MQNWYPEEWEFTLRVLQVGAHNDPRACRNGHQPGDTYVCRYDCPEGFCSKSLCKAFPLMEAVRSGGDLRNLGGDAPQAMTFVCPDGVVRLRLEARRANPDEA